MKTKAHQKYITTDGHTCPGVTTVIGQLSKPALPAWANRIALEGEDYALLMSNLAAIGTLGHALVTDRLVGLETDLSDYDPHQIEAARHAEASFRRWEKLTGGFDEVMWVEKPLVSDKHRYGGTADIYGIIRGRKCIMDLKTGSGIYEEHHYQVAILKALLEENGYPVDDCAVMCIPRKNNEYFAEYTLTPHDINKGQQIFMKLLDIYRLKFPKTKPQYPRKDGGKEMTYESILVWCAIYTAIIVTVINFRT